MEKGLKIGYLFGIQRDIDGSTTTIMRFRWERLEIGGVACRSSTCIILLDQRVKELQKGQ